MYERGDIVVVPFPFADSGRKKKRPALIISNEQVNQTGDYLMAQITTKEKQDGLSLQLTPEDFAASPLKLKSFIRCHKLFLLNEKFILHKASVVKPGLLVILIEKINSLIE